MGGGCESVGNGNWEKVGQSKVPPNTKDGDVDRIYANITSFLSCLLLKMSDTSTLSKLKISQVNVQLVCYLLFIKIWEGGSSGWALWYDCKGVSQKPRALGFVQIAWKGKEP